VPYDPAIKALQQYYLRQFPSGGGPLLNPDEEPNIFTGTKKGVQTLDTFGPIPKTEDFFSQVDPGMNDLSGVSPPDLVHRIAYTSSFEPTRPLPKRPADPSVENTFDERFPARDPIEQLLIDQQLKGRKNPKPEAIPPGHPERFGDPSKVISFLFNSLRGGM
jgi:hypothetical protein